MTLYVEEVAFYIFNSAQREWCRIGMMRFQSFWRMAHLPSFDLSNPHYYKHYKTLLEFFYSLLAPWPLHMCTSQRNRSKPGILTQSKPVILRWIIGGKFCDLSGIWNHLNRPFSPTMCWSFGLKEMGHNLQWLSAIVHMGGKEKKESERETNGKFLL